ncbi:putative low-complexity protein [Synechococcus sp. PCC 7502]|uniref:pentapeptide repeat-containing protein n=1 Tax=Synechococcus sp. PCC 7502 TaxID=1173263 RepID=UPI00029FF581|nr:pentapeptide repeat-containing protein [Synechococcus sp. PCC 7502]AFY72415.1 putative low-complexity protein [Synechococcus sp. PCC 7502]
MAINFAGKDLRGKSFRGQNLRGADFSNADIRGADFTKAILTEANFSNTRADVGEGWTDLDRQDSPPTNFTNANICGANFCKANLSRANFSHAKAGLKDYWGIFLLAISFSMSALTGALSGVTDYLLSTISSSNVPYLYVALTLVVFFYVVLKKGLGIALIFEGLLCLVALGISWTLHTVLKFAQSQSTPSTELIKAISEALNTVAAPILAITITGALAWTIALAILSSTAITLAGAVSGALAMVAFIIVSVFITVKFVGEGAIFLSLFALLLGTVIAWRTLAGDEVFLPLRSLVINLTTFRSTNFQEANLTAANFTFATLKGANFSKAELNQVSWYRTYGLDESKLGTSNLNNPKILNLVVTKKGRNGLFAGLGMQGLNLENADLQGVNFSHSSLDSAILRGANLKNAKLIETNLKNADLDNANLDGADLSNAKLQDTNFG